MTKYYVTFKEYNKSPRFIIVKIYRGVLANLATIKNGLIDCGIREENIEFIFGWSKIEE